MVAPPGAALQIPDTPDPGLPSLIASAIGLVLTVAVIALIVIALYRWVWPPIAASVRHDRDDAD